MKGYVFLLVMGIVLLIVAIFLAIFLGIIRGGANEPEYIKAPCVDGEGDINLEGIMCKKKVVNIKGEIILLSPLLILFSSTILSLVGLNILRRDNCKKELNELKKELGLEGIQNDKKSS